MFGGLGVTSGLSYHQYCLLCPRWVTHPRTHGFIFGCPSGDFPEGHPSWYYSYLSTLNCGVFHVLHSQLSPKRVGDLRSRTLLMNQESLMTTSDVGFA
ncbi:hypothetical protein HanRHA438_Chr08g0356851 [Helianthus annuus]|nr:hypothetical protein HanIR_Chr08g0372681 [Helianthus annuus]KAJ0898444.1 hypothetical protein HanRHA438_Chr08g0356851 [Helianthus annuus]